MLAHPILSLLSVTVFALVHLWADAIYRHSKRMHSILLCLGGGVAIAYVFVDLLPKLSKNELLVKGILEGFFPYFEKHVYVLALLGFLLFFTVDRSSKLFKHKSTFFWLALSSYALFNFLVGYAVVDKDDPEVQPLLLFTIAIGLHYFVNDYSLNEAHGAVYRQFGRWVLIAALYLGWLLGMWVQLDVSSVALVSAFIAGGVIMNVTRHEVPEEPTHSLAIFLLAAALYTLILLSVGSQSFLFPRKAHHQAEVQVQVQDWSEMKNLKRDVSR